MDAVEVRGLKKNFPGFELGEVSFAVPSGYVCGFVGPNGAGKTTTIKCLIGMMNKDEGEIRLLGRPAEDHLVREDIGVMLDRPYFQEDWTPRDIERVLRPFYRRWDHEAYTGNLERFGLDPNKKFKEFSRGTQQKLGMAVVFSIGARLLILDEPTGGLDPVARDGMLDLMREFMVDEDHSILFSTHITSDLAKIADTIVYISGGRVTMSGEMDEIVGGYVVARGGHGSLATDKRGRCVGYREHVGGFECLMNVADIGGLSSEVVTEAANIDDIIIFTERSAEAC
jgi:ABC-2 type transport system ATP-binding protein